MVGIDIFWGFDFVGILLFTILLGWGGCCVVFVILGSRRGCDRTQGFNIVCVILCGR